VVFVSGVRVYAIICFVRIYPHTKKLRANWLRKPLLTSRYRHWLIDGTSLTARLQQRYVDFHVQPLSQGYAKPIKDEAALLQLKSSTIVTIREVLLVGKGRPVVYAHSVLPHASLCGEWAKLRRLGNKPLGATLFSDPRVKRTPLTYKKLSRNHALYRKAVRYLNHPPLYLWARRSIFSLECASILVTEVFLPEIQHE
jgi:chorismate lyase